MEIVAKIVVGFVAVQHLGFLVLEMFLWRKPVGLKIFRMTPEVAESSAVLAANQGLYNGFLAAGLVWGLAAPAPLAYPVTMFFLGCVVVAGVFGGLTASRAILFVQALPGAMAMVLTWLAGRV